MARQPSQAIENNFSKGMITAASGMSFPQNAVTSASNCVFDYLGTVSRREGFDLEQGNSPKNTNWQGQAISSYLWHNVTGDNTTNIYVVQIGGKLYFYPVVLGGAAISPQLANINTVVNNVVQTNQSALDFSSFSSQAQNAFIINPGGGTVKSGAPTTATPMRNPSAAFDNIVNAASNTLFCTTDAAVAGVMNASSANAVTRAFIGKDFGASALGTDPGPQKIGTASIFGSSDLGVAATSFTYQNSQRVLTYTYQFQSQTATLTINIPTPQDFTNWTVSGNSTGASGTVNSMTFTGVQPGRFQTYNYSLQITQSTQTAFSASEALNFNLGSTNVAGTSTGYTVSQVYTTLNQTNDSTTNTNFTVPTANVPTINLRASNTAPTSANDASSTILGTVVAGSAVSNNTTTAWRYVWFEVVNTSTNFSGIPTNTDSGAITTGGTSTVAINTTVQRIINTNSAVSIQEEIAITEVKFFTPATSIGSPFVNNFECQYANGLGFLFVTHPWCYPFVVSFNGLTTPSTFTATPIVIQTRDFDGVDDGLQLATGANNNIQTRPNVGYTSGTPATVASLSPLYNGARFDQLHLYNLQNQGWNSANLTTWAGTAGFPNFPSNCDVWWYLKNSAGTFTPGNVSIVDVGSTAAPKGSFIFDAFYIDRGALVTGTNVISAPGAGSLGIIHSNLNRPSTVAFFAGRAWYSGVNYPNFSNCIWFSQILSPTSSTVVPSLGQCYQTNDPTSSQVFDLLPTDGGNIRIPDCGTIVKLFPMQGALLVFATNGIWVISGSKGGLGFTANDYSINRLSTMSCLSGQSIVDVQGQPMFWTNEGIYTIRTNVQAGGLQIQSMTYTTIDAFYKAIPRNSKIYARGSYNPFDFTVQWLYRSTNAVSLPDDNYKYDSVLVFNTITGGFYPFTAATGNVNLASIVVIETGLETDVSPSNTTYTFKYFVTYADKTGNLQINIADMFSTRYVDWFSYDSVGQQYVSTFTSGYKFVGQGLQRGIPDYIYFYVKNSPTPNSYKVQSIRDYGIDKTSGRWSSINLFTNSSSHYSNFVRRHRLRGRGLVLQYKVTSFKNDPFDILGWAIWQTAGTQP